MFWDEGVFHLHSAEISTHLSISNSGAEDGLAKASLPHHLVHAIPLHSSLIRQVKRLPRPEFQPFVSSASSAAWVPLGDQKAKTVKNDRRRSNSLLVSSVHAAAVVYFSRPGNANPAQSLQSPRYPGHDLTRAQASPLVLDTVCCRDSRYRGSRYCGGFNYFLLSFCIRGQTTEGFGPCSTLGCAHDSSSARKLGGTTPERTESTVSTARKMAKLPVLQQVKFFTLFCFKPVRMIGSCLKF